MNPVVNEIEELFLPELERLASDLRKRHPRLQFNVWHGPVGSLTKYQGHDVGIECILPRADAAVSDNVTLCIGVCELTTTPKFMADVVWGHPSGHSEAAFREDCLTSAEWPVVTQSTLEELRTTFPKLVQAFRLAVQRGAPPEH